MCRFDFNGKKILVTGASSGIGRATAIMLSELGAKVVINGRNEERLKETLHQMKGEDHLLAPYDLKNVKGIKSFVSDLVAQDNTVFDGLVFSVGISGSRLLRDMSYSDAVDIMETNYYPLIELLSSFSSRKILNNGGSIVALSSSATRHADKSQGLYTSSKAALEAMCVTAAKEFARRRIRVNTVSPEITMTPMTTYFINNCDEKTRRSFYPLGDMYPDDVANAIVFLLSDMSKMITGINLYISAGNDGRPINQLKIIE